MNCMPPCESYGDCWYGRNMDRIDEYCSDEAVTFIINNTTGDTLHYDRFEDEWRDNSYGCFKRTLCDVCSANTSSAGRCGICNGVMYNNWISFKGEKYCQFCISDVELEECEVDKLTDEVRELYDDDELLREMVGDELYWTTNKVIENKTDRSILRKGLRRAIDKGKRSHKEDCKEKDKEKRDAVKKLSKFLEWDEGEAENILEYIDYSNIPDRAWKSKSNFVIWAMDTKYF